MTRPSWEARSIFLLLYHRRGGSYRRINHGDGVWLDSNGFTDWAYEGCRLALADIAWRRPRARSRRYSSASQPSSPSTYPVQYSIRHRCPEYTMGVSTWRQDGVDHEVTVVQESSARLHSPQASNENSACWFRRRYEQQTPFSLNPCL